MGVCGVVGWRVGACNISINPLAIADIAWLQIEVRTEIPITVHTMIVFLERRFALLHTLACIPYVAVHFFNAACWLLTGYEITVTLNQAITKIHETRLAITCC